MVVMAAGCKQILQPPFLRELGLGAVCQRSCRLCMEASDHAFQETKSPADHLERHFAQIPPPVRCLAGGPGHNQLRNYAFLGPSGRIGTASDVVYAFVPAGPKKQLDMFFHGIECRENGLEEVAVHASVVARVSIKPR